MKKLSAGQKVLCSVLAAIIVLLPLAACAWVVIGNNSWLEKPEYVAAALILPGVFVLFGIKLINRVWK